MEEKRFFFYQNGGSNLFFDQLWHLKKLLKKINPYLPNLFLTVALNTDDVCFGLSILYLRLNFRSLKCSVDAIHNFITQQFPIKVINTNILNGKLKFILCTRTIIRVPKTVRYLS